MLQNERRCNLMKKDRLIALTDAVLAIIMTILILELEKPTTPSLQAFWDLRQNFFAYFLSFFWLGSLWMALNTLWEKVEKISSEIIWWNLFLLLERQEFSLEGNIMGVAIPMTAAQLINLLYNVVDRIYINVKDLPFQSLGALANILSDVKKGLIQDSHIWSFFQSFFKQYQLIISLNQIYQFVYLSLMEIMSYLHFDYWKKRLGQELV